jgi:hypothetical protein
MSRRIPGRLTRLAGVVAGALLLTLLFAPAPANAAGTTYSTSTWAGVRSWYVKGNLSEWDWRTPDTVQAKWQIPCLPAGYDGAFGGLYGAYDQWVGLEAQDGVNLIQVGIRSYHLGFFGGLTGYFAWVVNTFAPTGRSLVELFTVNTCTPTTPKVTITAKVSATGWVCIAPEARGDCTGTSPSMFDSHASMPYPRNAAFIVERFAGGTGLLPWFGWAGFTDAKVLRNGCCGWYIGTQSTVWSTGNNMTGTVATNNVWTLGTSPYGAFSLYQSPPAPTSYCTQIIC